MVYSRIFDKKLYYEPYSKKVDLSPRRIIQLNFLRRIGMF